jgi:hypothetical protein
MELVHVTFLHRSREEADINGAGHCGFRGTREGLATASWGFAFKAGVR